MKHKYNIKDNHYKMYGEANYLVLHKKKYLNNSKLRVRNYMNIEILKFIITLVLLIICFVLNAGIWIIAFLCISILRMFILVLNNNSYKLYKNGCHKGTIIIDKNGITDESDITTLFPWEKVELIGITKNMLAIVLDSPFVIILEPDIKVVEEIKKYKDIKVIESK